MEEKNFVITVENNNSPVIITIPHGGMGRRQTSWLNVFFEDRKSLQKRDKYGEVFLGGDINVMYIVADILKLYKANVVAGLLPRLFVDYNRFSKKIAFSDRKIESYYDEYHGSIKKIIEKLLKHHKNVVLFDFHGFGSHDPRFKKFDIIISTNKHPGPNDVDRLFFREMNKKYKVFCSGVNGFSENELFLGDTTNFHYHKKYGIDALLVEVSPKFRSLKFSSNARKNGENLAKNLAKFFLQLQKTIK